MQNHGRILRIILKEQSSLLNRCSESSADVGKAGVGRVTVDISLYPSGTDQHVPVTAGWSGLHNKVPLPLSEDLIHGRYRFTAGGKAPSGNVISAVNKFFHRFRE